MLAIGSLGSHPEWQLLEMAPGIAEYSRLATDEDKSIYHSRHAHWAVNACELLRVAHFFRSTFCRPYYQYRASRMCSMKYLFNGCVSHRSLGVDCDAENLCLMPNVVVFTMRNGMAATKPRTTDRNVNNILLHNLFCWARKGVRVRVTFESYHVFDLFAAYFIRVNFSECAICGRANVWYYYCTGRVEHRSRILIFSSAPSTAQNSLMKVWCRYLWPCSFPPLRCCPHSHSRPSSAFEYCVHSFFLSIDCC